jgi:AMP deaminase
MIYPEPPRPRWLFNPETNTWEDHKHDNPKLGVGEDFHLDQCDIPDPDSKIAKLENGVYQVYPQSGIHSIFTADLASEPIIAVPTLRDYYKDLDSIIAAASDGESKSFAYKRLQYLDGKWNLYILLNERQEMADSKVLLTSRVTNSQRVPHRDYYNVRKVDTHVHHSSSMNQKHLLRFIKSKLKHSPEVNILLPN